MSRDRGCAAAAGRAATGEPVDVVVLAGGTGRRLGGVSKADVLVGGRRMIDHLLDGLASLRPAPGRVVVVAPAEVVLPGRVGRALEDPPLGGPVAGIAAGLSEAARLAGLDGEVPAPWTAVLSCDAPGAWSALPALTARASLIPGALDAEVEAVVARIDGVGQPLLALYRTACLTARVAPGGVALRDVSVRRTLAGLRTEEVEVDRVARDLDTWTDIDAWSDIDA